VLSKKLDAGQAAETTSSLSESFLTNDLLKPSLTEENTRHDSALALIEDLPVANRSEREQANEELAEDEVGETTAADWDAAQEINVQEEEGEFIRFASQIKGRDLVQVRNEIDDEIRVLHQQRKAAMRDSEDITQQMVSQIMVGLVLLRLRIWLHVSRR
jgi:DNA excision repair protein ERCC-5